MISSSFKLKCRVWTDFALFKITPGIIWTLLYSLSYLEQVKIEFIYLNGRSKYTGILFVTANNWRAYFFLYLIMIYIKYIFHYSKYCICYDELHITCELFIDHYSTLVHILNIYIFILNHTLLWGLCTFKNGMFRNF